jgi:hypothetical protein
VRASLILLAALAAACGDGGAVARYGKSDLPGEHRPAFERAAAAAAETGGRLMARLNDAVAAEGFAGAIRICREVAPEIAKEVGAERGVKVSRTSHRLRNRDNMPPVWALPAIEDALSGSALAREPQAFVLEDGTLGVALPILTKKMCLSCHGAADELAEGVPESLADLYPGDRARGFAEGSLRGYFLVEVPPGK